MDIAKCHYTKRKDAGISLLEMIVTVTVMGILAASAIGVYERMFETSKKTVGRNHVETLNNAVKKYVQLRSTDILSVPANSSSSLEEYDILRAMQWNHPDSAQADPGAPYMRPDYDPPLSGSTNDYRAIWNGTYFELREPGESGAGLKIVFDASDLGKSVVFPNNFEPLSSY